LGKSHGESDENWEKNKQARPQKIGKQKQITGNFFFSFSSGKFVFHDDHLLKDPLPV
jgi:hypothetical protein